jgi:hypothetical protein
MWHQPYSSDDANGEVRHFVRAVSCLIVAKGFFGGAWSQVLLRTKVSTISSVYLRYSIETSVRYARSTIDHVTCYRTVPIYTS